jgi:hypothetical protein
MRWMIQPLSAQNMDHKKKMKNPTQNNRSRSNEDQGYRESLKGHSNGLRGWFDSDYNRGAIRGSHDRKVIIAKETIRKEARNKK